MCFIIRRELGSVMICNKLGLLNIIYNTKTHLIKVNSLRPTVTFHYKHCGSHVWRIRENEDVWRMRRREKRGNGGRLKLQVWNRGDH